MSGIATGTALLIGGGLGAAGGIASGVIGANAAGNAASTQANAADQAAQLQYQASQNALGFQEQQWDTEQGELQPWLQSGQGALSNLDYLLGVSPSTNNGATLTPSQGTQLPSTPQPLQFGGQPQPLTAPSAGPTGATPSLQSLSPNSTTLSPQAPSGGPAGSTPSINSTAAVPASFGAPSNNLSHPTGGPAQAYGYPPVQSSTPTTGGSSLDGYGSLMAAYPGGPFVAPTAAQALQSPGEQAQLQLGEQALQQSAAAQGNLLTGGTAQALNAYGQNLASTNYANTYNQAYNTYAANWNQYENQQNNEFNRLASLSGLGQTTASQLGQLGQSASNNVSSNLLGTASAIGQQMNNAGAANASGIVGSANAYGGAIGGATGSLSNLLLLNQLQGGGANPYSSSSAGDEDIGYNG